jgi:hypothetical protein
MKASSDVRSFFSPLLGQRPWRVRVGWGSFVTFDFGPRVRDNGHQRGAWHLWVRDCEWSVETADRVAFHSESPRHVMEVGARRLEKEPLLGVSFDAGSETTIFKFGDRLRLVCRPYSEEQEADDVSWLLFMPENRVLAARPKQLPHVERSDAPLTSARSR